MNIFLNKKARRFVSAAALALVLAFVLGPAPSQAGVCERALGSCLAAYGLTGLIGIITGGGLPTLIAAQFCANGYAFCLRFVV